MWKKNTRNFLGRSGLKTLIIIKISTGFLDSEKRQTSADSGLDDLYFGRKISSHSFFAFRGKII